jgi:hypothetical protein
MTPLPDRPWFAGFGENRGQSEMVGVVLILGLTITGSALVVAFGSSALSDAEENSQVGSAEHAMTQFDSRTSLVGLGGSSIQQVNVGAGGSDATVQVEEGRGWMRVRVINATDGSIKDEVMNQSLGVVEYRNGDITVAYQGGGVWKATPGGTAMVSPPEFHYHDRTLTLPLVVVGGDETASGRLEITPNGSIDPKFPLDGNPDRTNPTTEGKINVTVASDYYEAWGRFFRDRTGGEIAYDHGNGSVTITLVVPSNRPEVAQALASTSSEELVIKGSGGGDTSFTDSYNSSEGDYTSTNSKNGTIITSGGVEMSGGAEIRGDLVSGSGTVRMGSSNALITGNLSYGGSTDIHKKATVGGWTAANGSAPEIDPIDNLIDQKLAELEQPGENDNGDEANITGENVLDSSGEWELTAGRYYLEELDLGSGDTLVLNASNGDIVIAVDDDITFDSATVEVVDPGNNETNIFMGGNEFTVTDADVTVPDDESSKLWVYGPPDTSASFTTSATFMGVLYAPDTDNRQGEVVVGSQAEVFGALVGGRTTLQSGGKVHFDQSLTSVEEAVPGESSAPKLTYLHVTVNRVNVTSG